jgi:hypothetical protein
MRLRGLCAYPPSPSSQSEAARSMLPSPSQFTNQCMSRPRVACDMAAPHLNIGRLCEVCDYKMGIGSSTSRSPPSHVHGTTVASISSQHDSCPHPPLTSATTLPILTSMKTSASFCSASESHYPHFTLRPLIYMFVLLHRSFTLSCQTIPLS